MTISAPIGHFDGTSWFAGNNPRSEDGFSFEGDEQLFIIIKIETLCCLIQFLLENAVCVYFIQVYNWNWFKTTVFDAESECL